MAKLLLGKEVTDALNAFTPLTGFSFLVFNLLCAPCFAAMGAIKREMNSTKWTAFTLTYMTGFAYVISMFTYERVNKIPLTSTGKVRKELQAIVLKDPYYRRLTREAININPTVYNMLIEAFAGGYTHANFMYTDEVLPNVDSFDETSAYPYVMVAYKYPMKNFTPCTITKAEEMIPEFAYLLRVTFKNLKCKYYNHFISASKCNNIINADIDNGRIIRAKEINITLTDVDFKFILDTYNIEEYTIEKCYYSVYNYLPKLFIDFILDKYVNKTKYKNVKGKELEYIKEKNKFNSLYGNISYNYPIKIYTIWVNNIMKVIAEV